MHRHGKEAVTKPSLFSTRPPWRLGTSIVSGPECYRMLAVLQLLPSQLPVFYLHGDRSHAGPANQALKGLLGNWDLPLVLSWELFTGRLLREGSPEHAQSAFARRCHRDQIPQPSLSKTILARRKVFFFFNNKGPVGSHHFSSKFALPVYLRSYWRRPRFEQLRHR